MSPPKGTTQNVGNADKSPMKARLTEGPPSVNTPTRGGAMLRYQNCQGFVDVDNSRGQINMKRHLGILTLATGIALPLRERPNRSDHGGLQSDEHGAVLVLWGSLLGVRPSGILNLDTSLSRPARSIITTANLNIVDCTYDNGGFEAKPVSLGFDLTLDGVTHISLRRPGRGQSRPASTPSSRSARGARALQPAGTDRGTSASW